MNEIKAYKCDYCKRYGIDKGSILKHESRCYYNPVTRSCGSCEHLKSYSCTNGIDVSKGLKTMCERWDLHSDLIDD